MNQVKTFVVGSTIALSMASFSSFAGTNDDPAFPDVTIADTCTIDAMGVTFAFGTFPVGSADITDMVAGSVAINCVAATAYTWGVDGGSNWDGASRNMSNVPDLIAYTVELTDGTPVGDLGINAVDASYTDTTTIAAQTGVGTGAIQSINLQADAAISTAPGGYYIDMVTFTVAWP